MGGSSLAPDVLHRTFGSGDGWLDLRVLDSTDPAAVAASVDDLDPLATLWIVASKSGTTTEPLAFQADAWDRAERALRAHHAPRREHAGELMVAITDPGRSVEAIPHHDELREVFLNPPDIGGRYSALTYVGLVPASLIGLDLDALLASALAMAGACREPDPESNPGVSLGLAIGTLAKAGRDKLTFVADPAIDSFGAWAEQLIAESTGKHGTGIVPVDREPLGRGRVVRPRPRLRPTDARRRRAVRPPATPSSTRPRPPVTRSSGSSSPTRSTSAPRCSAGRSRPRSPARSSASTRSTSPTSRKRRTSPARSWPRPRRGATPAPRRPRWSRTRIRA